MEEASAFNGLNEPSSSQKVEQHNVWSTEENISCQRSSNLTLLVPRKTEHGYQSSGENPTQNHFYSKGSSSVGNEALGFPHGLGLKNKAALLDGETNSLLTPELAAKPDKIVDHENALFANIVAKLSWERCASLPVKRASDLAPSPTSAQEKTSAEKHVSQKRTKKVSRSLSVPMRNIVIVRSGSFASPKEPMHADLHDGQSFPVQDDEEIPEEEAVCRICLVGLNEGGNWLKMECSCKGDLMLTHEECAVKWFSIKGNKTCDVCGQEVLNLPVTLLRAQSSAQRNSSQPRPRENLNSLSNRTWQDMVVLILISTMCYFFFLEQLLVTDMKSRAVMIAAPFSLTLGLLGSVFSIVLARREYVWAYAAFEFSLVVTFLHFFYSMLRLKAVLAILFASFAGFGIAVATNSCCLQYFAWRARLMQSQMNAP